MKRILMLFLALMIAAHVDKYCFGQGRFDSIPADKIQVSAQKNSEANAKAVASRLNRIIRSKNFLDLDQIRREIKQTKAFKEALPVLRQSLRDVDPDIKFMGLMVVAGLMNNQEINPPNLEVNPLLPEIVALIRDKDAVVRYSAVSILSITDNIDDSAAKNAIPALIEYLRSEFKGQDIPRTFPRGIIRLGGYRLHDRVRQDAAKALKKIGPQAVPALLEALKDNNVLVREGAARAVAEFGPQAKESASLLLAATKDSDSDVRFRAAVALWKVDHQTKPVIPILIEELHKGDIAIGIVAAETLGEIGPEAKEAVPVLIEVVRKETHIVCSVAAEALGKIGPEAKAAVPTLVEVLRVEDESPPKLPESINDPIPALVATKEKNPYLQLEAARAIRLIDRQSKAAVPALIELLKKEYYGSRPYAPRAAEELGEMGLDAIDAVPELLKATKGEDPYIREVALKALKKIDPKAK